MPELEVQIGGRGFKVTCQDGQENFLRSAAAMLDAEVAPLLGQSAARPTDVKMLLTAGLMLADKTAAAEDELRALRARVSQLEGRPTATRDVAVIPPQVIETLAEIAARAEAVAARMDEHRRSGQG
jgi:cell division protein ZapA